jgi:predicted Zn-dependent protease
MKKPPLAVEELEDRMVLTTFGAPWPDPEHLTLSFAPDQSPAAGGSDLFRTLDALAPPAVWQTDILRAFQTWAQYANINIGLVSDDGAPLGVAGAPQDDPRFGDIRVAAFALDSQELAVASPFDVLAGTNSGDVRLNSNDLTGANSYDLFSIFLHEAGHVLGVDHSNDPASPM